MSKVNNFPRQQLPSNRKTKKWRKECVDWASDKTYSGSSLVRKTVRNMCINYDLVNGKVHMEDMMGIINPESLTASYIPDKIPHYPIINSKIHILTGEESDRVYDYRVVVTNPNSISEIEENKKNQMFAQLQQIITNTAQSEEEANQELEKLSDYYTYSYQDMREIKCNALIKHYSMEQGFDDMFNAGFKDGITVGEEIYQCYIENNEPKMRKLNPRKVSIYRSGYSNKIEDADIIILEDYMSPGQVIDNYYEALSPKDMKYLEEHTSKNARQSGSSIQAGREWDDDRPIFEAHMMSDVFEDTDDLSVEEIFSKTEQTSLQPFDMEGNVRVTQVYWKSRRKIKKVKSYDPQTGEEEYHLYPESYIINPALGEEEKTYWINESWEGTKIGDDIYVNMRPTVVQYNRLYNPSRCHFGIVGSIYNFNDDRPYSMVDMMKPYNYLYDAIHDRLNKMMARNWGKLIQLDLAKVPAGWDVDKWLYYARTNGLVISDSFKEGNMGAAMGHLAGALNNNTSGVIDAEFGNSIQSQIQLLEFIKAEMSEVVGITRQREGQISNRETVGGIERATLQSSHITEWVFTVHEDVKKRAIECFLETAKVALKGRNMKFQYLLPDNSLKTMDIDGDEFAESDYGLVVDNSNATQKLQSQIETLAQAALQNQTLSFSTIMKIYNSASLAEKERMIELDEQKIIQRNQQAQQEQIQSAQQLEQMKQQTEMMKMQLEERLNQQDNETKILVAQINALSKKEEGMDFQDGIVPMSESEREKLNESIRQFDEKMKLERDKLSFEKSKADKDAKLKEKQINKQSKVSKS